ncbi:MAG: hypothetical protein HQL76_06290 [Magnetococcales bacterium]|nr:hypothetical protein [Magnetococcales bacterium]
MNENKSNMEAEWVDPDDAPELTDTFFEEADEYIGNRLIRRGRQTNREQSIPATEAFITEGIAISPV